MMLQALLQYAERRQAEDADFADPDFEPVNLHWLIPVSKQGRFLSAPIPTVEQVGKKQKPRRVRRPFTSVNEISVRSLDKAKSYFLCDTIERIFLFADGGKLSEDPLAAARQTYFKRLLNEAKEAGAAPDLLFPVIKLLETNEELARIREALNESGAKGQENAAFQVEGEDLLSNDGLKHFWRAKRSSSHQGTGEKQICLVTGELTETVDTTEKVKGIGGQDTNLISANEPAFRSFGLEKAKNSPISGRAEKLTRAALNELISRGLRIQDTVHLHWTRKPVTNDPFEMVESANPEAVRNLLESPRTGTVATKLDDTAYYLLSLSGNGGRIVVRDWLESTLGQVRENIRTWFADLAIIKPEADGRKFDFKLGALLYGMAREKLEELPPQVPTQLLHAAIKGGVLPETALAAALRRQQVDDNKLNPARLALIKAVLARQDRFSQRKEKHNMTEQLNSESRDSAYLCGRLFAVFDRLQYLAQGGVNAGVVERYYASASVTPALVMGRLFRNAQFHLAKAGGGIAENVRKDFEEISCALGDQFKPTLTLEEQGRFALGYYHQKAEYRRRTVERKKAETKETATA